MGLEQQIRTALEERFAPETLEVINESGQHRGHAGDDGTGESHWRVVITAPAFAGMPRLARHRAIHAALGEDILDRIHALSVEVR